MNIPAKRLDIIAMTNATHQAKSRTEDLVDRAIRLQGDTYRTKRIRAGLCRWCYYAAGRVGGAAMTSQPCSACSEEQVYASTCTDVLCLPCAVKHDLCKRCGGDQETRTLRRKWPALPL